MWDKALSNRWGRIALALAAGLLAGLAHPPFNIWLGLVGYPVLMLLAERSGNVRGGFWMGWLFGFAYFFIGCWWVAEAFFVNPAQAWMAPFAASLLPAGIGLFTGAAAALYRAFKPRGLGRILLFVACFSGFEWLRGHVLTGFPWNPVGASWMAGSAPSQFASVVGVYGLGLVTLLAVCSFAPLMLSPKVRANQYMGLLGVAIISALFGFGSERLSSVKVENSDTLVRIVQANVAQENKWSQDYYQDILNRYLTLTGQSAERRPDVVIWPESALPDLANNVFARADAVAIAEVLQEGQVLLAGMSRADVVPGQPVRYYNSLFALTDIGEQGLSIDAIYDKHRLVPFGEYLPLGDLMGAIGVRSLVQMPADISGGPVPQPMSVPKLPVVQPLICYESLFPGFTNMKSATRPEWIANVSNDAWFGQTSGPKQHLNLASYRVIETGLPMARATPTGVSAMIDPLGRVVEGSRIESGEARAVDVWLPKPLAGTIYGRLGDIPYAVLVLLLVVGAVLSRRKAAIT